MAGIKKIYTSQNEYLEDVAASSEFFDREYYETAKESGKGVEYLSIIAGIKDNISETFNKNIYDRLSSDEKFNYLITENLMDKSSEEYAQSVKYFDTRIDQLKREEIYNSLSGFDKTMASIAGFVGNAVLQTGAIVEGLIDGAIFSMSGLAQSTFVPLIAGKADEVSDWAKNAIAKDVTGYHAAQAAMDDYINVYTFIDKNFITKTINDVTAGLVRMLPMLIPGAGQIGAVLYYGSMMGNTAEQTIKGNPDINYGALLAYTGASVGLEALTEWASGKLFGDDIISSLMKGEKYAPTGSIVKNVFKNFATEGLEEATSELFGSILYNVIVDPKADIASFGDIMYAALIGGLTGAIMSGGQVLTTKKMSVMDGKLVDTSSLTKEQRKTAKNLTKAQSYGLNNLLYQAQQATQQTDEVTKLMSKYGLSLQDVQTEHAEEYQEALEKDTETKTQQAKGILELANLMNTIGVEQFQRSSKLLNEQIEEARTMVNNYLNHSTEYNKAASDAYSAAFDGQSMTPTAQLTNSEQTLVKTLREVYPNLKVAFGTFGSKEGFSVRSIAGTKGWLFIESGLVDKMGYQALLEHAIKNEMTNSMITALEKLPTEVSDALVRIVTEDKTSFKDLSEEQKQTIAQIVCFDPVNNRRIFRSNNKSHSEIFKYVTDQANFIKNYARKNDANTLRYRELLKIRNTFLNSIAQTINNAEDVDFVTNEYKLAQEEVKTKIIDKTNPSILNINRKLTSVNLAKDAILREEAISELLDARNKLDKTTEFDYSRLYDESYYADKDWVNSIKTQQQTNDFETALKQHLVAIYKTSFDDRTNIVTILKNNLTEQDVRNAAKELLTKEFNTNVTDYNVLQNEVVNTLYDMLTIEIDDNTDYIVVEDNTIKGAGKLKFIISEVTDGKRILSEEQRREDGESSGEQTKRLAPNTAKYENKLLETAALRVQTEDSLDEHQQKLKSDYKQKYNLDLKFFKGNISYRGQLLDNANGLVSDNTVYLKYDGTLTDVEIDYVLEHEATHKLFAADEKAFEEIKSIIEDYVDRQEYNEAFRYYASDEMYGKIYDHDIDAIKEELINDIIVGEVTLSYSDVNEVNKKIEQFKERATSKLSNKIDSGVRFSISKQNEQELKNIQNRVKAKTGKEIADAIIGIVKTMPMKMSEAQGFEIPYMYRSIEDLAGTLDSNSLLFHKINDKNWAELYGALHNSVDPDSRQALILLEAYLRIADQTNTRSKGYKPLDDKTRFSEQSKNEIMALYQSSASLTGQQLSAISKMVSDKTSFSELKQRFEEDGFTMSVPDKVVQQYVPEVKDKKSFEKEINKQIDDITEQIENGDDLDKAALNQELSKLIDKKYVILNESNEAIIDWALSNEDVPTVAAKIQQDVFKQFVATAELAEKTEGKKALTILVDEKTGLPKPFPKTTQYVQKAVKGLKSFRMWAMLTSPVSWVRNWVGNAGMTALDKATNQFEKFLTNRQPTVDIANLEKQQKALQNKKDLTPTEQAKLAELNAQITRAYDFKFVETTASKDLKKQIAEDYKTVFQQILNGEDVSKYEGSAEKAGAIARAERDITRKSENANFVQKVWAACQSMTDWGLNTGVFGDNAVVLNSLVRNFANMVESNKSYLIKSLTTEYGKDGSGMSDARRALVEKALKSKDSMDIINAMSKADVELFMDSCKQRTFEQYFKNSNWLSKWASNLSQKHPIAASLTSLVLPFPKVAANVLTMAYKYSPLGFISALRQWSVVKQMDAEGYKGYRDAFARAKLNRTTSQATVGTMMCIAGLILASLGVIDIEEDDYMGPSLHIGDLRISLSDLAPSMTTLSVGAGMMWAWKNDKSAVLTALDVLYDNTLLGNIENVFKYGSPDKYIENLSINYVSQYVPAMLKLFTKITTNQEMIDKSGTYFEKLWKTFGSGIPGIAHVLPKRVNPYTGEFLTSTGSQNVFFNFIEALSPLDFETTVKSPTQKEAERLNTKTTGLSGTFKVNDTEYVVDKVTYSKYRADYIQTNFEQILSGKQKVTVEDDNGKRITTTYDKLNDKQKKNVIDRLYTEATNITKIKWWTDLGNKYVVTNEDQYKQYRKLFDTRNIVYKETWNKSKFMER